MSCEERNFSLLEVLSWDTRMFQRSVVKLGEPTRSVQIGKRGRRNDMGLPLWILLHCWALAEEFL